MEMDKRELNKLKELALKGKLDEESMARLLQFYDRYHDPDLSCELSQLEEDVNLSKLLLKLPDVPVSSNFTARVMDAVEKEEAEPASTAPSLFQLLWQNLTRRLAPVSLIIALIGLCYFSYNESKNTKIASSIAELDRVAMLNEKNGELSIEILRDFDVIQNINNYNSMVDIELLAALKNQ